MAGWIKFDKEMAEDPRLMQAAWALLERYVVARRSTAGGCDLSNGDASRFVGNALRGALVTLWVYADTHIRDDDTLPCDAFALDAIVGLDGFCEVMPDEWLVVEADGGVRLPGYCVKNGLNAKRKRAEDGRERTRRWRQRQGGNRDASRARHGEVSVTVDLDQDQDHISSLRSESASASNGRSPPKGKGIADALAAASAVPNLDADAWARWVQYRRSIGKTLKPASLPAAAKQLAKFGAQQSAVVEQSIANGWQGLFAVKAQVLALNAPQSKPSSVDADGIPTWATPEERAEILASRAQESNRANA